MKISCPCRTRECRWSNVQIAEKKSQKMKLSTAICAECLSAKNAEPPGYAPNAPTLDRRNIPRRHRSRRKTVILT